mmetsp:Transcript_8636/g.27086  ORF Transcript_8636/g.27086 Transcript_8636/m.27086 type:complete len:1229 (+) Transcript_8636:143-3829(+)
MCGNLGLLLVGDDVPKAVDMLLAMGQVTSMRGAQSFGFVASSQGRMRVHKAVVRKREDIAVNLARAFKRTVGRGVARPLSVCAHLRFATSSKTTRRDAHPHVWLQNVQSKVVTLNPTTQLFTTHWVSRAVVVTHNGDFEAFDLGACFGRASKCVDLSVLRDWLTQRLEAPPPSSGDSIVAAGMLELLFAAGDPWAAARLAFVASESGEAADPAPREVIAATAGILSSTLLRVAHNVASELSYSLNGQLTAETRRRHLSRLADAVAQALCADLKVSNYLAARGSLVDLSAAIAAAAVRGFFEADLRSATRQFLRRAHGSFGLVVASSLAPNSLVVASIKQPMAVGIGPGFVVYGSERAALHVGRHGEALVARRVLSEGEVVWFAPGVKESFPVCAVRMATASTNDDRPFRALTFSSMTTSRDFDMVRDNPLVMPPIRPSAFRGDVVGKDIAEIPSALRKVRDSFRDPDSPNSRAAATLARALFPSDELDRVVDLVVIGAESSLWLAEQWAANVRSAFPKLRIVVASSNKVLASLTAVANDSTCGAQTPGYTVFPSGCSPAEAVRGAVALVVSHSGQTFPSLNASRALKRAGAAVFSVAGLRDTVVASDVIGQSFALGAPHSDHIFSTDTGIRLAEAASLTTVAIHVLLTEILYAVALELRANRRAALSDDDCALVSSDLADLRQLQDECVDTNVAMLCTPTPNHRAGTSPAARRSSSASTDDSASIDLESGAPSSSRPPIYPHDEAVCHGRRWGNHVTEPFLAFLLSVAYVLATVTAGTPCLGAILDAAYDHPGTRVRYAVAFLDAVLYAFFPVVAALALRLVQRRVLLARFGKRTVLVLDVPQVHQCVVAFAQKLFGLSYGLNGIEVAGFNPSDHAVHRCLHRVVRGTLVALGVPDGRLRALIDSECAAFLTASQIKSIENWGVGPELVTIGHHTYSPAMVDGAIIFDAFKRPAFLSEVAHGTGTKEVALPSKPFPRSPSSAASPSALLLAAQSASFSASKKQAARPSVLRQTSTSDARRVAFLERPSDKDVASSTQRTIIGGSGEKGNSPRSLDDVLKSLTVVETLYEGRIATLERQIAFYVFFHTIAKRASTALWPFFGFDTWRSQAGTRVATTPSPTSPATEMSDPLPQQAVRVERVTTLTDFQDRQSAHNEGSHLALGDFFHVERDRRAYDTLTADDDSDPGLDLSAHDAAFWHAGPIPEVSTPNDDVKPDVNLVYHDETLDAP